MRRAERRATVNAGPAERLVLTPAAAVFEPTGRPAEPGGLAGRGIVGGGPR
jgi:hypothetical protein